MLERYQMFVCIKNQTVLFASVTEPGFNNAFTEIDIRSRLDTCILYSTDYLDIYSMLSSLMIDQEAKLVNGLSYLLHYFKQG